MEKEEIEEKVHSKLCQRWSHLYIEGNPDMTKKQPSIFAQEFESVKKDLTIESQQKQIEELKKQLEQREEKLLLDLLEWLSDSNEHNIRKSELSEILEDYFDYKQIKQ